MNPSNLMLPRDFQLLQRRDDQAFFLAPRGNSRQQPYQELPLIPVEMGYHANNQFYSLTNVPADAPARKMDVIA